MNSCGVVAGALGALGSLFFIGLYVVLPDIRNVARRLLLSLSLVELLQAVLCVVQGCVDTRQEFWCWVVGPLLTASTMSSALWTTCGACYVEWVIQKKTTLPRWAFVAFRVVSWGYPALWVLSVIGLQYVRYRHLSYNSVATGDCFESLTFDPTDKPLYWLGYTLPLAACLWGTASRYLGARLRIRVQQRLHPRADAKQEKKYGELATKYALLPTLFVMSRSWIFVEGLVAIYDPSWLPMCSCLRTAGIASQGLMDTLIFVLLTFKLRNYLLSSADEEEDFSLLDRSVSGLTASHHT